LFTLVSVVVLTDLCNNLCQIYDFLCCANFSDVFSYPEDDMVVDPLLADHLAHFGIDIMSMKKVNVTVFSFKFGNFISDV